MKHMLYTAGRNKSQFRVMTALFLLIITFAVVLSQTVSAAPGPPPCRPEHVVPGESSAGCLPRGVEELSAQANPADIKPLLGQTAAPQEGSVGTEAISYPDFTYRTLNFWSSGSTKYTIYHSSIRSYSRVMASTTEVSTSTGQPHSGGARYTVHNVTPFEGGVTIWVSHNWGSSLLTQINLLVLNS